MKANQPAVALVSGGLDSAVTLALAIKQGFAVHALTFQYGQRHAIEIDRAKKVCASMNVAAHRIVPLDLTWIGGSALTDRVDVPKDRDDKDIATGIPVTYVPARNTVFLSLALAYAESIGAFDLFIGVNAIDYSGYPDCQPEFIKAFVDLANLATKAGVEQAGRFKVHTPLIEMTKAQIIRQAVELDVDLSLTHSCYDPLPDGRPCGRCDSCRLRAKGFFEAGLTDPAG